MKETPADVMKAAEAVADIHAEVDNWLGLREAIARAIMVERERCATAIENWQRDLVPGEMIQNAIDRLADRVRRGDP